MFVKQLRRLGERGDTVVEVLIAIGIISMVMAGAFVMTNHSLQTSRDAQERLNATKLVESQIEQIKSLAVNNPNAIFGAAAPATYCVNSSGNVVADTNAACTVDITGAPTTGQPSFHLSITRATNTFTVQDAWTSFDGKTNEKVFMEYRVYQQ